MKLEDVGERALLALTREICDKGYPVQIGVGDDAASVEIEEGSLVVTTDMLIGGIHFFSDASAEQIGKKAVVVNLSDLAAMGAKPLGLVYSIGAPGDMDVEFIPDILQAMNSTAREYGAYLIGGDLNEAKELIISGTALGTAKEDELLLRSGAKPGDVVAVTGELGASIAATKAVMSGVSLENKESLKRAFFEPVARVEEGRVLSESGKVNSAIDITDGLAANLWQISRMSGVKLIVDEDKFPINKAAREFAEEQAIDMDEIVLFGGEDFELIFTVRSEAWDDLSEKLLDLGTEATKIGVVEEGSGVFIERGEGPEMLSDRGYEHFLG